jgi:hypothetical protein
VTECSAQRIRLEDALAANRFDATVLDRIHAEIAANAQSSKDLRPLARQNQQALEEVLTSLIGLAANPADHHPDAVVTEVLMMARIQSALDRQANRYTALLEDQHRRYESRMDEQRKALERQAQAFEAKLQAQEKDRLQTASQIGTLLQMVLSKVSTVPATSDPRKPAAAPTANGSHTTSTDSASPSPAFDSKVTNIVRNLVGSTSNASTPPPPPAATDSVKAEKLDLDWLRRTTQEAVQVVHLRTVDLSKEVAGLQAHCKRLQGHCDALAAAATEQSMAAESSGPALTVDKLFASYHMQQLQQEVRAVRAKAEGVRLFDLV